MVEEFIIGMELIIGIVVGLIVGIIVIYVIMKSRTKNEIVKWKTEYESDVQQRIEDAKKDSLIQSRSTLKGKIGEQMAPLLPEFTEKYEPSDARFIGSPIDYLIFKNMSRFPNNENNPIEIVLMDVKTGKSTTTPLQNAIKEAITNGRVSFDVLKPEIE